MYAKSLTVTAGIWYAAIVKLHQATHTADWANTAPGKHTRFQRLAMRTHGIVTPGNITSVAGLLLVLIGLYFLVQELYVAGLAYVVLGRLCDILDGMAADATNTKSPLGEAVDATCDKAGAIATLLVIGGADIASWWVVGLVGLQNIFNIIVSAIAKHRRVQLHPTANGKISVALQWVAIAGFISVAAGASWLAMPSGAIMAGALVIGATASMQYVRAIRGHRRHGAGRAV